MPHKPPPFPGQPTRPTLSITIIFSRFATRHFGLHREAAPTPNPEIPFAEDGCAGQVRQVRQGEGWDNQCPPLSAWFRICIFRRAAVGKLERFAQKLVVNLLLAN